MDKWKNIKNGENKMECEKYLNKKKKSIFMRLV
jgi:hypothetical protein